MKVEILYQITFIDIAGGSVGENILFLFDRQVAVSPAVLAKNAVAALDLNWGSLTRILTVNISVLSAVLFCMCGNDAIIKATFY